MSEQQDRGAVAASSLAPSAVVAGRLDPWIGVTKPWRVHDRLSDDVLDGIPGVPRLAVQLLHNRGVREPEDVRSFLATSWRRAASGLPDLDRAVERILRARDRDEVVVVWGDYDCDGMTSCALLVEALRRVGVRAEPYVALREDDGRGLNREKLPELVASGTQLILTTDCGTVNVDEVAAATELGIDVIVTDHHPPHGPLAGAYALINPHLAPQGSADTDAAGVAVAFRLAEALFTRAELPDTEAALDGLLDLVAVGTIADVVPLSRTNWALARAGMQRLNTEPRPGLRALLNLAGHSPGTVNSRDVAFSIAPRLNAAGRLGMPLLSVRLLLAGDAASAGGLAAELETLQQERQRLTEIVHAEARAVAMHAQGTTSEPLIALGDGWPLGILGLAASRLVDEFHRPAFVISRDMETGECRGSARGPKGVDLGASLAEVATLFRRFGGHAQAAGFTLAAADLPALLEHLRHPLRHPVTRDAGLESQAENIGDEQDASERSDSNAARGDGEHMDDAIAVDCQLPLRRLVPEIADVVRSLEPYGTSFPEPIFISSPVRIVGFWRSGPGGKTLRLRLREGDAERVAFWPRQGELYDVLQAAMPTLAEVSVVYSLVPGRDGRNVQARILTIHTVE